MSDHKGARLMLDALPPAAALLADKGYDSNWFRAALLERGIDPCIPFNRTRNRPLPMTSCSIGSATGSRTRSDASRNGDASQRDTIDAQTPSSAQSASLHLSSSGSMSPEPRAEAVADAREHHGLSERRACLLFGANPRVIRYRSSRHPMVYCCCPCAT